MADKPRILVSIDGGKSVKRKLKSLSPEEHHRVDELSGWLVQRIYDISMNSAIPMSQAQKERAINEAVKQFMQAVESPPSPAQPYVDQLKHLRALF